MNLFGNLEGMPLSPHLSAMFPARSATAYQHSWQVATWPLPSITQMLQSVAGSTLYPQERSSPRHGDHDGRWKFTMQRDGYVVHSSHLPSCFGFSIGLDCRLRSSPIRSQKFGICFVAKRITLNHITQHPAIVEQPKCDAFCPKKNFKNYKPVKNL